MTTIFEAAGGEAAMRRLAERWHARVLADPVVGHAFSHGFRPDHTERLAAYWTEALGGPDAYTGRVGDETAVVRLHSGNGEHQEMDARAIECFDRALEDAGLAADERLRRTLHDYFAWATHALARYPASPDEVPEGLTVPRWTWDGPATPEPRAARLAAPDGRSLVDHA
jgi:hemoglobin